MGSRKDEKEKPFFLKHAKLQKSSVETKISSLFCKIIYDTFINAEQTITDAKPTLCTKLMLGGVQNVSG